MLIVTLPGFKLLSDGRDIRPTSQNDNALSNIGSPWACRLSFNTKD